MGQEISCGSGDNNQQYLDNENSQIGGRDSQKEQQYDYNPSGFGLETKQEGKQQEFLSAQQILQKVPGEQEQHEQQQQQLQVLEDIQQEKQEQSNQMKRLSSQVSVPTSSNERHASKILESVDPKNSSEYFKKDIIDKFGIEEPNNQLKTHESQEQAFAKQDIIEKIDGSIKNQEKQEETTLQPDIKWKSELIADRGQKDQRYPLQDNTRVVASARDLVSDNNHYSNNEKAKQLAFLMNPKLEFALPNNGKNDISSQMFKEASKENIFNGTKDPIISVNQIGLASSNQIQIDKQSKNTVYTPSISKDIPKSNSNSSKDVPISSEDKNNQQFIQKLLSGLQQQQQQQNHKKTPSDSSNLVEALLAKGEQIRIKNQQLQQYYLDKEMSQCTFQPVMEKSSDYFNNSHILHPSQVESQQRQNEKGNNTNNISNCSDNRQMSSQRASRQTRSITPQKIIKNHNVPYINVDISYSDNRKGKKKEEELLDQDQNELQYQYITSPKNIPKNQSFQTAQQPQSQVYSSREQQSTGILPSSSSNPAGNYFFKFHASLPENNPVMNNNNTGYNPQGSVVAPQEYQRYLVLSPKDQPRERKSAIPNERSTPRQFLIDRNVSNRMDKSTERASVSQSKLQCSQNDHGSTQRSRSRTWRQFLDDQTKFSDNKELHRMQVKEIMNDQLGIIKRKQELIEAENVATFTHRPELGAKTQQIVANRIDNGSKTIFDKLSQQYTHSAKQKGIQANSAQQSTSAEKSRDGSALKSRDRSITSKQYLPDNSASKRVLSPQESRNLCNRLYKDAENRSETLKKAVRVLEADFSAASKAEVNVTKKTTSACLVSKIQREFNESLQNLQPPAKSLLTYIQMEEILRGLSLISDKIQIDSVCYAMDRSLINDLWVILRGHTYEGVSPKHLLQVIMAICGISINNELDQLKKYDLDEGLLENNHFVNQYNSPSNRIKPADRMNKDSQYFAHGNYSNLSGSMSKLSDASQLVQSRSNQFKDNSANNNSNQNLNNLNGKISPASTSAERLLNAISNPKEFGSNKKNSEKQSTHDQSSNSKDNQQFQGSLKASTVARDVADKNINSQMSQKNSLYANADISGQPKQLSQQQNRSQSPWNINQLSSIGILNAQTNRLTLTPKDIQFIQNHFKSWYYHQLHSNNPNSALNSTAIQEQNQSHRQLQRSQSYLSPHTESLAQNYRSKAAAQLAQLTNAPFEVSTSSAAIQIANFNVKQKIYEQQRQEKQDIEVGLCSFHPETVSHRSPSQDKKPQPVYDLLYSQRKNTKAQRDKSTLEIEYERSCDECTFKPHLVSTSEQQLKKLSQLFQKQQQILPPSTEQSQNQYQQQQLNHIPVKNAEQAIRRMRQAREEHKYTKLYIERGYNFPQRPPSMNKLSSTQLLSKTPPRSRDTSIPKKAYEHNQNSANNSRNVSNKKPMRNGEYQNLAATGNGGGQYNQRNNNEVDVHSQNYRQNNSQNQYSNQSQGNQIQQQEMYQQQQYLQPSYLNNNPYNTPEELSSNATDKSVMLYVDVNLGESHMQRIIVREGDTAEQLATQFIKAHNLPIGVKPTLIGLLNQQINSYLSSVDEELRESDQG